MGKIRIGTRKQRPAGHRLLGALLDQTEKAAQFDYHGHALWLPKSAVKRIKNTEQFTAPSWAIDNAKDFEMRRPLKLDAGVEFAAVELNQ